MMPPEPGYEIWVNMHPGLDCLYQPGPFSAAQANARVERYNGATRGRATFYKVELPPPIVQSAPFPTRAPESNQAYWQAQNDGTLDWRRRDILHFLEGEETPQTADDYYAAQSVPTTGYGTQFALLRRAGYIRRDGRKKTRSNASAAAYRRGTRVVGPDFGDKGHFTPYNMPVRATIREAIILIEQDRCDEAKELLEDLVDT